MTIITRSFTAAAALMIAVISGTQSASAFSTDDATMSTPQAAQRFSDPDERTPAGMLTVSPSASFRGGDGAGDDSSGTYSPSAASFSGATPAQGDIELRSRH